MGSSPVDRIRSVPPTSSTPPVASSRRGELRLVATPTAIHFVEVVELFCRLLVLEEWPEMRGLLSGDARLESIAALGVAGPGETIEAMRFASAGETYTIDGYELEPLDGEAVLLQARIRHTQAGDCEALAMWLVTGRNGLIRRARIVASREQALEVLARDGHELGV